MTFAYYAMKAENDPPLSIEQFKRILKKERITFDQWVRLEPKTIAEAAAAEPEALRNWATFFISHIGKHYTSPEFKQFEKEFQEIDMTPDEMLGILDDLKDSRIAAYFKNALIAFFDLRKINGHPRDLNIIWPHLDVFAEHPLPPENVVPLNIYRQDTSRILNIPFIPHHTRESIDDMLNHRYMV